MMIWMRLHEATLDLMENYGLQIHGKEALEIYSAAGCEVDKSPMISVKVPKKSGQ